MNFEIAEGDLHDIERYLRGSPLLIVGEGTNTVRKNTISAQLVQRGGM